jgi:phosphoribosylanthranilate isomerase
VDAPSGGSGDVFDHTAFAAVRASLSTPLIVAGGLTPETVSTAMAQLHPWGVDVSSGVERERGTKDAGLIAAFCAAVRA